MADKMAKERRSKAKDSRQTPAPDIKPKRKPGKKDKPIRVEYKWREDQTPMFGWCSEWSCFGRYRTEKEAETAIKNDARKHGFYQYRVVI